MCPSRATSPSCCFSELALKKTQLTKTVVTVQKVHHHLIVIILVLVLIWLKTCPSDVKQQSLTNSPCFIVLQVCQNPVKCYFLKEQKKKGFHKKYMFKSVPSNLSNIQVHLNPSYRFICTSTRKSKYLKHKSLKYNFKNKSSNNLNIY